MAKSIFIYGASGHGLVVADIAIACGYDDITFIDDGDNIHPSFKEIQNNKHILSNVTAVRNPTKIIKGNL